MPMKTLVKKALKTGVMQNNHSINSCGVSVYGALDVRVEKKRISVYSALLDPQSTCDCGFLA